jgi:hypothetical protein
MNIERKMREARRKTKAEDKRARRDAGERRSSPPANSVADARQIYLSLWHDLQYFVAQRQIVT